ncbi:MAG: peptide chain release factor N(5)-glutamine methyltransferase [Bdellovibrionaceae bacterium]|jgi:release factor glutamine methyltransferase|nr:peptide chain release factor N(5)-glutamine methyltransferase [Pseudobdellovibrionaceae bacterium]
MILKEVLEKSTVYLKQAGFQSPRLDCELMFAHTLGLSRLDLYLKFDRLLSEDEKKQCRALLKRRHQGEPVSYILNKKEFFGLNFYVDENVLIPRPETELIIEEILQLYPKNEEILKVLDFGCGSGCIGLSLMSHYSKASLVGFDISAKAIDVSIKNSESLDLMGRSQFVVSDIEDLDVEAYNSVDIIVANPPYIAEDDENICENVKKFEPNEALFSNEDGLAHIKSWLNKAAQLLKTEGYLFMEFGATQGAIILELANNIDVFNNAELIKDYQKFDRIIKVQKK